MAETTVRYPGPLDAVEVLMPADTRGPDDPRHEIVEEGGTLTTSAEHAKALVESGWEPVSKKKGGDEE